MKNQKWSSARTMSNDQTNRTTIKLMLKGRFSMTESQAKEMFNNLLHYSNGLHQGDLISSMCRTFLQALCLKPAHFEGLNPFPRKQR